jgi:hypothetical protein
VRGESEQLLLPITTCTCRLRFPGLTRPSTLHPCSLPREYARRAGSVVELDTGHHPFLSRPGAVGDLVLNV